MFRAIIPGTASMDDPKGILPRPHAVKKVRPRFPDIGPTRQRAPWADGNRSIRTEAFAERGQGELPTIGLVEHALRSQRAQQPVERSWVDAAGGRKVVAVERP